MNRRSPSRPSSPTRADRLEDVLRREEQGKTTLAREMERYADDDETIAADLRLIASLRQIDPPAAEGAEASRRVAQRLHAFLSSEAASATASADAEAPGTLPVRKRTAVRVVTLPRYNEPTISVTSVTPRQRPRQCLRMVMLVAALLLLISATALGVSNAAASALPGMPLYGVKQADEWLTLQAAWSDTQRGQALAQIADHRLAEARAEAQVNPAEAQSLTHQCARAIHQIITLLTQMRARNENTGAVAQALSDELQAEQTTFAQAQRQGFTAFAQSLTLSIQEEQTAIVANHLPVSVPSLLPAIPSASPAATGHPTPSGSQAHSHPTGTPDPNGGDSKGTPTSHPTPTPHGGHGKSRNDNGHGGGNGHGNGHGNGS
ncbi:MAG: DUF5667 domain-containing protein [Ktedonobacterales bacterium]